MTEMVERVADAIGYLIYGGRRSELEAAYAAIEALRVTDEDVMRHEWLVDDHQETINAYLDQCLIRRP